MRQFANGTLTQAAALGARVIVLTLNVFLILTEFGVPMPGT